MCSLEFDPQASRLFLQNALDGLHQIKTALVDWPQDNGVTTTYRLMQVAHQLKVGAADQRLTELESLAQRLRDGLWQIGVRSLDLDESLRASFQDVQTTLWLYVIAQVNRAAAPETLAQAQTAITQLEVKIEAASKNSAASTDEAFGTDPLQQQFWAMLPQLLVLMETMLQDFQGETLAIKLQGIAESLTQVGAFLQLPKLTLLAQRLLQNLQETPHLAQTLGQLALITVRTDEDLIQCNLETVQQASSQSTVLKTEGFFVWATGNCVYLLPYEHLVAHLIPSADQIVVRPNQRLLRWQEHEIPTYPLSKFFKDASKSAEEPKDEGTVLRLVLQRHPHQVAIESSLDQLITASELPLQMLQDSARPYLRGLTSIGPSLMMEVIDVLALLDSKLERAVDLAITSPIPEITVLVIDDSKTIRELLALSLQEAGYCVQQAANAQAAIALMQQETAIQMAICDIDMPQGNGFDFLNYCRQTPDCANLPIIMLSHSSSEQERELALQLGATVYLTKSPVDPEFLGTLKTILEEHC